MTGIVADQNAAQRQKRVDLAVCWQIVEYLARFPTEGTHGVRAAVCLYNVPPQKGSAGGPDASEDRPSAIPAYLLAAVWAKSAPSGRNKRVRWLGSELFCCFP